MDSDLLVIHRGRHNAKPIVGGWLLNSKNYILRFFLN